MLGFERARWPGCINSMMEWIFCFFKTLVRLFCQKHISLSYESKHLGLSIKLPCLDPQNY